MKKDLKRKTKLISFYGKEILLLKKYKRCADDLEISTEDLIKEAMTNYANQWKPK